MLPARGGSPSPGQVPQENGYHLQLLRELRLLEEGNILFVCFFFEYGTVYVIMLRHKQIITKYMYGKMKQNAVSKNQNHEWST